LCVVTRYSGARCVNVLLHCDCNLVLLDSLLRIKDQAMVYAICSKTGVQSFSTFHVLDKPLCALRSRVIRIKMRLSTSSKHNGISAPQHSQKKITKLQLYELQQIEVECHLLKNVPPIKPLLGLGGSLIATVLSAAYTVMINCCVAQCIVHTCMQCRGTVAADVSMKVTCHKLRRTTLQRWLMNRGSDAPILSKQQ
jgi:hypothetical protein